MIYNPTPALDAGASAASSSVRAPGDDAVGFNFTTILCVAWSTCGRNIAFGTPDGIMVFSTEQALESSIATQARPDTRAEKHDKHSTVPAPVPATVASQGEVQRPAGLPPSEGVTSTDSLSRGGGGGGGRTAHQSHVEDAELEAESLRSMSPLTPWEDKDDSADADWGVDAHHFHNHSLATEDDDDEDDEASHRSAEADKIGKNGEDVNKAERTGQDYLLCDKAARAQVGVREVCRRLIEGGVGTVALCGQSSIIAVAGAASPYSPHAARTVKVVDVSEPYHEDPSSLPATLDTDLSVPDSSDLAPPSAAESASVRTDAAQPGDGGTDGKVEDDLEDAQEPVNRFLGLTSALRPGLDTVGPVLPSGNLARLAYEERLVRAACQRATTSTADTAPARAVSESVVIDLDAFVSPTGAPAVPLTPAETATAEAISTFRRQHGPAILCEQVFSAEVGALCLTPYYLIVAQAGHPKSPEQSCLYVYNRQWTQSLCLYFFPCSDPRFTKDCFAVASTWSPSLTPHLTATGSATRPAHGLRYHHAVLPGDKRGAVRLLSFQKPAARGGEEGGVGGVSAADEAAMNGTFSVDQIQAFTSTPIRAVAVTADGTRAVVTSEEGKRIKLLQIRGGTFDLQFLSLDRGLTRAVNDAVSLHVVNIPDWQRPSGHTTPSSSSAFSSSSSLATRYALVAMVTTTGTVHLYLVDVARQVQWECLGVDTRLRLVHDELGVSLRFPEPTVALDKAMLLVLQFPDSSAPYARGEHRVDASASAPSPLATHTEAVAPPPPSATASVWQPFRLASYQAVLSSVTRAERPPAVQSISLMKSASSWLKRDVAGSKSSGTVPSKAEGSIQCQFNDYLPFL